MNEKYGSGAWEGEYSDGCISEYAENARRGRNGLRRREFADVLH
jgi:hypothetical protein